MDKFTFDGANRLFICKPGVTEFDVQVDLYSDWKEEIHLGDNMKWPQALRTIGGDPTKSGQFAGDSYFLMNDWKIRPQEADHELAINGNLFLDDGETGGILVATVGDYTVLATLERSNLIDTIGLSGLTTEEHEWLAIIMSLSQRNIKHFNRTYNVNDKLLSTTIKGYASKADLDADLNPLVTLLLTAEYDPVMVDRMIAYKVTQA